MCVVFIVSTTGDGQPPDTAIKFFRRLNRSTLKINHLEKLHYALLGKYLFINYTFNVLFES